MLRGLEGAPPIDFSPWSALRFTAASSRPGYYAVRIEQEGIDHNSTNVTFLVDDQMQEILIPLNEFATGVRKSRKIVFAMYVDSPGAEFDLRLDDLQLVQYSGFVDSSARFSNWSPTRAIARQNARFYQRPILYYFHSQHARPSREFDKVLLSDSEFASLARDFVLCRINVSEDTDFARSAGVFRLPSAMVAEMDGQGGAAFYAGTDTSLMKKAMQEHLRTRSSQQEAPKGAAAAASKYDKVLIDDFSDKNLLNDVGGNWGTFDSANSGAFAYRYVEIGPGNIALDVSGSYPPASDGGTWGGVYTDITPDRNAPRSLAGFQWIAFICSSDTPGQFEMRLEGADSGTVGSHAFNVGKTPERVVVPISALGAAALQARTIVWTRPSPQPGDRFSLTIDDLMVIRKR